MLEIVIPALNEEARLPRTLRELRRHVLNVAAIIGPVSVVVVDNASTDETTAVALAADSPAMPVRVVRCEVRGKGAAVQAGVAETSAEVVAFMDADGATRIDALEEAWRRVTLGADVAIGSRAVPGAVTSERHHWARAGGARVFRNCTARVVPGVRDTQCGFKLMDGDLARILFRSLRTPGFSFDVELLALAQSRGARIDEFPVVWADVPGSTFDPRRHGLSSFASLAAIAWRTRHLRSSPAVVTALEPAPVILSPVVAFKG